MTDLFYMLINKIKPKENENRPRKFKSILNNSISIDNLHKLIST